MKFKKILAALSAACITLVSAASMPANGANHSRVGVHDPSIVKLSDGSYYIMGSHLAAARSNDLGSWTFTANSQAGTKNTTFFNDIYTDLAVPASWSSPSNANYDLSGNLWAPDVIYNEKMGKYCMYLSVNGDNWKSSIVLCTADNIDGPYKYVDTIVYSGFDNTDTFSYKKTDVEKVLGSNPDISRYLVNGSWNADYGTNAIDPAVFYDENGALWMIYGSWFGGLFMLELDENTGLRDYNVKYDTVADKSDAYMGIKAAGGHWVSGEGPYIEYMEDPQTGKGYYYLFVSYGCFNNDGGYNMRIFRSENPTGPYVDQNGNSAIYTKGGNNIGGTVGMRLMSNYKWNCNDRPNKAQGHNSVLMDDDGKLYVIYHNKFDDQYGFHEVRVHQLIMNEDGWPVATPFEYVPGEKISEIGHSMEAVTGEYEFIFHQLNQKIVDDQVTSGANAEVEYSQNITLNADGTVSGDITGTWSMKNGSPEMSVAYGGVTYKGSFMVQADESADMIQKMTFTATGNNTCVWGCKKTAYDIKKDLPDVTKDTSKLVYNAQKAQGTGNSVKIGNTKLLSGVSYTIRNKNSGLPIDLTDGSTADGTNIQQWADIGGFAQEWRITAKDNGYCVIQSMNDESKCIAVADNSAENGINVELQSYTGADNQLWKLVQDGAFYGIVSKCSGDKAGLDVFEWSTESGGNINQWEYWGGACQQWSITPVYPQVNTGKYTIKNLNSGHFVAGNNSNVEQGDKAVWDITRNDDGSYTLAYENGKLLTVEDGSAADGANLILADASGSESQKFTLHCNDDGSYSVMSVVSGSTACADIFEISLEKGANICQWSYWGGDGQKFIIEPVSVESTEIPTEPATTATEAPTEPVQTTSTEVTQPTDEPIKIIGDVNADKKFNIADVVMLQKWLVGAGELTDGDAADLSLDGKINVFDLVYIKRLISGK